MVQTRQHEHWRNHLAAAVCRRSTEESNTSVTQVEISRLIKEAEQDSNSNTLPASLLMIRTSADQGASLSSGCNALQVEAPAAKPGQRYDASLPSSFRDSGFTANRFSHDQTWLRAEPARKSASRPFPRPPRALLLAVS